MSKQIIVQAHADHIASIAKAAPIAAIEELVWNALDANAHEIRVDVLTNALGAVEAIRVADDGTGIDILNADATFGGLGGSWKRNADAAQTPRRLHGCRGCGRFKAFALGGRAQWNTTVMMGESLRSYAIVGEISDPGRFELEALPQPGPATGTEVLVQEVRSTVDTLLNVAETVQSLAARFALYLKSYPDVRIYFNGLPVTPIVVQNRVTDYRVQLENGQEARLEVIEWKRKFVGAGRIVFAGPDGFGLHERAAGVRSGGIPFTAYYVSPRFPALNAENALLLDELNPEVRMFLEAAKKVLKAHFVAFAEKTSPEFVREWNERLSAMSVGDMNTLFKMLKKRLKGVTA